MIKDIESGEHATVVRCVPDPIAREKKQEKATAVSNRPPIVAVYLLLIYLAYPTPYSCSSTTTLFHPNSGSSINEIVTEGTIGPRVTTNTKTSALAAST